VANRIRVTVQDLGKDCIMLVQDCGNLQSNPSDTYARQDISTHARNVTEKVGDFDCSVGNEAVKKSHKRWVVFYLCETEW